MKVVEGGFGKQEQVITPKEMVEKLQEEDLSVYSDFVIIFQNSEVSTVFSNLPKANANLLLDETKLNLLGT